MENQIVEEIMKECSLWERIIVRLFLNLSIKVYHVSRINTINKLIKN